MFCNIKWVVNSHSCDIGFLIFLFLSVIIKKSATMDLYNIFSRPRILINFKFLFSAPFFVDCISEQDLDEMNIEIIRNTLYKAYLEAFYNFCKELGGTTADTMCEILAVRLFSFILCYFLLACLIKMILYLYICGFLV